MISSLLAPPCLLRRLLSAVLALSVLSTMLGSGHPECEGSEARHGAASPSGAHEGVGAAHDEGPSGDDTAPRAPHDCPHHDRHDERGAAQCALVAHCAAGALAIAAVVPASRVLRVEPTIALTASRPLDASYPPDSPPPKA